MSQFQSRQRFVCSLLRKVEHPQLLDAVNTLLLRVRASMSGSTFSEFANHLSAQVSELPDSQSSTKISSAATDRTIGPKRIRGSGVKDNGKRKGIYVPDGSVWTGFYSDWATMSSDDKQVVLETRKKNKGKSSAKGRQVSDVWTKLKDIKSQMADLKRTISALTEAKTRG